MKTNIGDEMIQAKSNMNKERIKERRKYINRLGGF